MIDPLHGSSWSSPGTVAGFAQSAPNATLIRFAAGERERGAVRALDLGCGAGRNAVPLASLGWNVVGLDLSGPMLDAAAGRARAECPAGSVNLVMAPMEHLPLGSDSVDLWLRTASGIWRDRRRSSGAPFARRLAWPGRAPDFSSSRSRGPRCRRELARAGEPFVFTEFSGEPQCFLTRRAALEELEEAGFVPDSSVPLTEHNRPRPGTLRAGGPPVIYEGAFRFSG